MNSDKKSVESAVQAIHKSPIRGTIIECGSGAIITNKLMEVSGASATVYHAMQPYSKEIQMEMYGHSKFLYERSVSKEFVASVLWKEGLNMSEENNFIFASSIQMSDGMEGKITHGWFGFISVNMYAPLLMHFTFPNDFSSLTRLDILEQVGTLGISLIYQFSQMSGRPNEAFYDYVAPDNVAMLDMAYVVNGASGKFTPHIQLVMGVLEKSPSDYFICFKDNDFVRFEDVMRTKGKDTFLIEKGSFNPLHHGHKRMMEAGVKYLYDSVGNDCVEPLFMVSTYRYDKPHLTGVELVQKIQQINDHGYTLLVCKQAFYYKNFDMLYYMSNKKPKFYFVMGSDTMNRIAQTDWDDVKHDEEIFRRRVKTISLRYNKNFRFLVFLRKDTPLSDKANEYDEIMTLADGDYNDDGISSTAVRAGLMKNKLDDEQNN